MIISLKILAILITLRLPSVAQDNSTKGFSGGFALKKPKSHYNLVSVTLTVPVCNPLLLLEVIGTAPAT